MKKTKKYKIKLQIDDGMTCFHYNYDKPILLKDGDKIREVLTFSSDGSLLVDGEIVKAGTGND
jgi:hypothetical protein